MRHTPISFFSRYFLMRSGGDGVRVHDNVSRISSRRWSTFCVNVWGFVWLKRKESEVFFDLSSPYVLNTLSEESLHLFCKLNAHTVQRTHWFAPDCHAEIMSSVSKLGLYCLGVTSCVLPGATADHDNAYAMIYHHQQQ